MKRHRRDAATVWAIQAVRHGAKPVSHSLGPASARILSHSSVVRWLPRSEDHRGSHRRFSGELLAVALELVCLLGEGVRVGLGEVDVAGDLAHELEGVE